MINSEVVNSDKDRPVLQYPKLMRHEKLDLIVLFHAPEKGTVVFSQGKRTCFAKGYYRETWLTCNFIDCSPDEKVILSNKS